MADNDTSEVPASKLSKEQKIGFVLLSFFSIFAIGLGILQIRNSLLSPFALTNAIPTDIKDEVNTPDALRFRDTDRDGLNDFDELYVYTTSPYLEDTDSDGKSDREEIDAGSDPLCSEDGGCDIVVGEYTDGSEFNTTTLMAEKPALNMDDFSGLDIASIITNPEKIRSLLIKAGLSEEVLKNIPDEELILMATEALNSEGTLQALTELNSFIPTSTES